MLHEETPGREARAFHVRSVDRREIGLHLVEDGLGWSEATVHKLAVPDHAREAELCYATLAMVTDYDCWHESEEAVTVEMVVAAIKAADAEGRRRKMFYEETILMETQ